jgi:hypothetical protein
MWVRGAVIAVFAAGCANWLGIQDTVNDRVDTDHDGIDDSVDNCVGIRNPDQSDKDGDGIGDPCDVARPFDFTGDGIADVAVVRNDDAGCTMMPTGHTCWYYRLENTMVSFNAFGLDGDVPAAGDYDGDGKFDIAIFRPSNAHWWKALSATGTVVETEAYGYGTDIPVVADWDLDGKADRGVWRPSIPDPAGHSAFFIELTTSTDPTMLLTIVFGLPGDIPFAGDYDGDGLADAIVYRPSESQWYVSLSSGNYATTDQFVLGTTGDIPLLADFTGDRRVDMALYSPATGTWTWRNSANHELTSFVLGGMPDDIPVPADYDGDGAADPAVYRNMSDGSRHWIIKGSTDLDINFGLSTDVPVEGPR